MDLTADQGYLDLLQQISDTYTQGRIQAVQAANTHITQTYWQVGRQIVEFEQAGKIRVEYGRALLVKLSADLGLRHGRGFSRSNLTYMRLLCQRYRICEKPSHILSWSWARTSPLSLGNSASPCVYRACKLKQLFTLG